MGDFCKDTMKIMEIVFKYQLLNRNVGYVSSWKEQ